MEVYQDRHYYLYPWFFSFNAGSVHKEDSENKLRSYSEVTEGQQNSRTKERPFARETTLQYLVVIRRGPVVPPITFQSWRATANSDNNYTAA